MRGPTSSRTIAGIGTIAHELGHLFGLPDLYDRGDITQGIGAWGLMGYGSWGADPATDDTTRPVHMTAYSKYRLGVLDPQIVSTRDAHELPPIEEYPVAHMIRDGLEDTKEYFLLEYRKRIGFDSELPGDGILIWHVDDAQPDYNSSSFEHPTLRLEEASAYDGLATERFGTVTQMWRADMAMVGGFSDLSGDGYTNSRLYSEQDFYVRFYDWGGRTYITANNFSMPDAVDSQLYGTKVMTYDLSTLRATPREVDGSSGNFTLSWKPSNTAEHYEVERALFGKVDSLFDGAEDGQRSHALWNFSGAARRSSGSAASGQFSYMLAAMDESEERYLSEVQSMTLRQPFRLTESSIISCDVMSHVSDGKACLALLLSKDGGETLDHKEGGLVASAQRGRSDVGYELQYSDDLVNWSIVEESEESDVYVARFRVDAAVAARFVRLHVFMRY